MNNEFKMLWFEDNGDWYGTFQKSIGSWIFNTFGLKLISERNENDDFDYDCLKNNSYDLILVDYRLEGDEPCGNIVIENIRDKEQYVDVLFYSSAYNDMIKKMRSIDPPLQGVYHCNRGAFKKNVEELVSKIICRSENVTNLCGTFSEKCSDNEDKVVKILNLISDNSSIETKETMKGYLKEILENLKTRHTDTYNKILSDDNKVIECALDTKTAGYFSAYYRLIFLDRCIKEILIIKNGFRSNEIQKELLVSYVDDVTDYRNAFSHKKVEEGMIKIKGCKQPVNQEMHRQIRKNLNDYDYHFDSILKFVEEYIEAGNKF